MPSFGKSKTAGQNSVYRKGLKMNTSTKKSTKKHAEFLLYGGKDVHLQPKIVINNNNSTEMKRIILSVLAIGLSMGVMAQTKVYNGAEPMKSKMNAPKAGSIVYPATFNECASIEEPLFYIQDGETIYKVLTGTNSYGDLAFGQRYSGTSYQITGIAAVLGNLVVDSTQVDDMAAVLYDANGGNIGNELSRVAFTTADLPALVTGEEFELKQFSFPSPVSASDFLCVIEVPELTVVDGYIGGNIAIVTSTEADCATGEMSYSYSALDEAGTMGWTSISAAWGSSIDFDLFIFPIVEGAAGLSDVELNSLSYVYPNPAKSEVMLASSLSINKVEIVNVLGQLVFVSDVNANSIKVNTSDFAAGNYIVKMYTESGVATKKLVVE